MDNNKFILKHANLMARIDREREENQELHAKHHDMRFGIRSSHVSALVAVLLKMGIFDGEDN